MHASPDMDTALDQMTLQTPAIEVVALLAKDSDAHQPTYEQLYYRMGSKHTLAWWGSLAEDGRKSITTDPAVLSFLTCAYEVASNFGSSAVTTSSREGSSVVEGGEGPCVKKHHVYLPVQPLTQCHHLGPLSSSIRRRAWLAAATHI